MVGQCANRRALGDSPHCHWIDSRKWVFESCLGIWMDDFGQKFFSEIGIGRWQPEVHFDRQGQIWILDQDGIAKFDGITWQVYHPLSDLDLPEHSSITALTFDSANRPWIVTGKGSEVGGVAVLDGEKWEIYTSDNSGLLPKRTTAIAIDNEDRVFIGTETGLSVFDGENWLTYSQTNSPLGGSVNVSAVAVDSTGRIWVGTHAGLYLYGGSDWIHYNVENSDLDNHWITAITIDAQSRGLITTLGGLTRFDGENFVSLYNAYGGGINAVLVDSEDRILIADWEKNGGLTIIDAESRATLDYYNSPIVAPSGLALDSENRLWISQGRSISFTEEYPPRPNPWLLGIAHNYIFPVGGLWFPLFVLAMLWAAVYFQTLPNFLVGIAPGALLYAFSNGTYQAVQSNARYADPSFAILLGGALGGLLDGARKKGGKTMSKVPIFTLIGLAVGAAMYFVLLLLYNWT